MSVTSVVLAGVGGQGSVLAGTIIARAATLSGHHVATTEVHGMAQRGGSVFSTVRFGDAVFSPMVPEGEADFLLAFERLEALRYLGFLRPGGVVLVNDQRITPTIESLKVAPYPEGIAELLRRRTERAWLVPALAEAERLGNPRLANTVMLGVLSRLLPIAEDRWRAAISERVPPRTVDANLMAFARGRAWAEANLSAEVLS